MTDPIGRDALQERAEMAMLEELTRKNLERRAGVSRTELTWEDVPLRSRYRVNREEAPEKVWLWEQFLYGTGVTLLAGQGNTGKTRLFLELSRALAEQEGSLHGLMVDPEADPETLYVQCNELDPSTMDALLRLTACFDEAAVGGITPLHNWYDCAPLPTENPENPLGHRERVLQVVKLFRERHPKALVILDSATSLFHIESTDAREVARLFSDVKASNGEGPLVLVHHLNKDTSHKGANQIRGSTAWADQCDRLILLSRTQDGGLRYDTDRRGPHCEGTLPVDWADAEQRPKRGQGAGIKQAAIHWIQSHRQECTLAPTVKAAWELAKQDGLDCGRRTFEVAYLLCDLTA